MYRCSRCGCIFSSEDKRILRGCPECNWNRFDYVPNHLQLQIQDPPLESIRVEFPGCYHIDLRNLFRRKELILRLGNGVYAIHLGSVFRRKREA